MAHRSHLARVSTCFTPVGAKLKSKRSFAGSCKHGAPLDQVEIACASDAHVALVWEKALRHEWPVTLGPGIPAPSTGPGARGDRLLRLDRDRLLRRTPPPAASVRRPGHRERTRASPPAQAARTLARAEAGWGRATYALSLGLLEKSYESRAIDPDLSDDDRKAAQKKAELTARISRWITHLVAAVPEESANGKVPLQKVVEVALEFLERSTSRASQLDHRSAAALIDYVKELRALGTFECSLGEALRFIRERVESLQVAPERPRPGHLYACRLQQAGYSGRPHLFVVGLEEGRVFPAASEDPVLLDSEREQISGALKRSADRIDEAVWAVLSRLATAGARPAEPDSPWNRRNRLEPVGTLTLSYSCRDTREFRETYASWLMLQSFRLQQGNATLSYQQMKAALGEPVSSLPLNRDAAATTSGWWLRTVVGTGDKGVEAVEASFGALARGREAAAQRDSEQFTEFDGHVPAAGAILDPCAAGNAYSVTELENAAGCPYRFFLKRGLGLRPVDDGERDKEVWLDPLTRGSELHDIYAALLRRCRDAGRRPDAKDDGAWVTKYAQDALDAPQSRDAAGDDRDPRAREPRLSRGRCALSRGGD